MKVDLIDHMGSDLTVVNAARVSMDKTSDWYVETDPMHGGKIPPYEGRLNEQDQSLIKFLAKNNHWTPFGHPQVTFRIKAPIFVARQLGKHQVGLVWNEVSRRYVKDEPEFFTPPVWRQSAPNVKQGSLMTSVDSAEKITDVYRYMIDHSIDVYNAMLDHGVAPEQARMVLPQSMYTEWYWTGSFYAFISLCKLRLDPHAQEECRVIAHDIAHHLSKLFPYSFHALMREW